MYAEWVVRKHCQLCKASSRPSTCSHKSPDGQLSRPLSHCIDEARRPHGDAERARTSSSLCSRESLRDCALSPLFPAQTQAQGRALDLPFLGSFLESSRKMRDFMVVRAARARQPWALSGVWQKGVKRQGGDHYLLSCRNQLLVAQPLTLPLPEAAQPAWLSGAGEEKEVVAGTLLLLLTCIPGIHKQTIYFGNQGIGRSTATPLVNGLFSQMHQPEFQKWHHRTDFWYGRKNRNLQV